MTNPCPDRYQYPLVSHESRIPNSETRNPVTNPCGQAGNGSIYFMFVHRLHHWVTNADGWQDPPPGTPCKCSRSLCVFDDEAQRSGPTDGPAKIDVGLAVSRDGIKFTHVGGRLPFIPVGQAGSWEAKMVWALPSPVLMPGGTPEQPSPELWLYYAGHNKDHDGVVDRASRSGHQSGISVARLRLDGFLSMDAPLAPLAPGKLGTAELTTVPLLFSGKQLQLNLDARAQGSAYVEVLHANGTAVAGFGLADSLPMIDDDVAQVARWRGGAAVGSLQGQAVRLRFVLSGCKLYAFQFV